MKPRNYLILLLAILFSSCVKDEMYNGPANVSAISFSPASATPDDSVAVTAVISAVRGIQTAKVVYNVNGGEFNSVLMTAGSSDTFAAKIPKQADQAIVTFYIDVITNGGFESKSIVKTYKVGAIPPNYAAIILNEVDGNKKFVELYNNSDNPVNISGMAIIKNGTSLKFEDGTPSWVVPTGTIIPGRGYGVIKCSGYSATADPGAVIIGVVGDGMSAKQTLLLELVKPDATVLNTFQRGVSPWGVTISAIATTDSYSRCPDGTGAWKTALSTCGKANGASTGDIPSL
ncbi:MAG: lamin tail domain-containing protein [Chitinophagaceae bacterium]|nr:lamin tail domain-containing protein [Chitinophagaceae bacterium]